MTNGIVKIAITPGMGIGPEITKKALQNIRLAQTTELVQCDSLLDAIQLAKAGRVQAIVTGPMRKSALQNIDGNSFAGQTELLHHHLAKDDQPPLMCFAGGPFLLGLATVHIPLAKVSETISRDLIRQKIIRLCEAVKKPRPKITVLGVNPHAGEGGLLGDEEQEILTPEIKSLSEAGFDITGPGSADGFFGHLHNVSQNALPDAVLAMYHDQGLAPYKLLARGKACNITIGLTVVRTSPAHGTADDIARKGNADPSSMIAAIEAAEQLAIERNDPSLASRGRGRF